MDKWKKLSDGVNGRDKLLRLIQFTSRLIWSSIEDRSENRKIVEYYKDFEYLMNISRKLFLFGRGYEVAYSSLNSLNFSDPVLRLNVSLSQIAQSLMLFSGDLIWLNKVGFISINNRNLIRTYNRFWLYYVFLNFIRDLREINLIIESEGLRIRQIRNSNQNIISEIRKIIDFISLHKALSLDTLKNFCDLWIPLTNLGHVTLSPTATAVLGIISSICAMVPLVNPLYRI